MLIVRVPGGAATAAHSPLGSCTSSPPPLLLAALQDSEAIEVRVRAVPQPLPTAFRTLRALRALRALIARRVPSEPQQRARVFEGGAKGGGRQLQR